MTYSREGQVSSGSSFPSSSTDAPSVEDTYRFLSQLTEELGTRFLDYRVTKVIRLLFQLEARLQLAKCVVQEKAAQGEKKVPLSVVLKIAVERCNSNCRQQQGRADTPWRSWGDGGGLSLTVEDGEFILSNWSSWERAPPNKPISLSLDADLRWIRAKSTPSPASAEGGKGTSSSKEDSDVSLMSLYGLLHRCQDPLSARVIDTLTQLLSIVAPNGLPALALEIGEELFEDKSAEGESKPKPREQPLNLPAPTSSLTNDGVSSKNPRKGRTLLGTLNSSAVAGVRWADSCLSSKTLCRSPSSPITPTYRQSGSRRTNPCVEGTGGRTWNGPNLIERAKCEQAERRYRQLIEDAELLQFSTFLAPLSKREMSSQGMEDADPGDQLHQDARHKRSYTM
jgi:hypothetical protein